MTPTYKYVLQSIGLLLVTSVCISLTLGTKLRLALMGTTATEEDASRTLERVSSGLNFQRTGQPSSSPSEQLSEGNSTQKNDDHVALLAKVDLLCRRATPSSRSRSKCWQRQRRLPVAGEAL